MLCQKEIGFAGFAKKIAIGSWLERELSISQQVRQDMIMSIWITRTVQLKQKHVHLLSLMLAFALTACIDT